ncbi:hypothetical protein PUN28_013289 [Cardiocondyla obscurior]|uniref:Uncharacterized protein n=1 Tax=Cardiocondyla obscurior TaxID=286306 RepID=A0AAW2FCR2_9HYME
MAFSSGISHEFPRRRNKLAPCVFRLKKKKKKKKKKQPPPVLRHETRGVINCNLFHELRFKSRYAFANSQIWCARRAPLNIISLGASRLSTARRREISTSRMSGSHDLSLVLNSRLRGDVRNTKLILARDISALSLYVEDAL